MRCSEEGGLIFQVEALKNKENTTWKQIELRENLLRRICI